MINRKRHREKDLSLVKRFLHFCPLLIKEGKQEKITQRSVEDKKETRKLEREKKYLVKRKG